MFDVELDEPTQPTEPTPKPEIEPAPSEELPTEQPSDEPTTPQPQKKASVMPWLIGGAAVLAGAIGGVLALLAGKKKKKH